jgi:hypothetical protein
MNQPRGRSLLPAFSIIYGLENTEDTEIPYLADPDHDPALAPLHAAACTYRIALGPRAGQKVLTWKDPALRLASQEAPQPQGCVRVQGFSLHVDTRCGPQQRDTLERLCRYITRPALGHKRGPRTPAGEVALQLKTPYRDGTTHLVMTPLEFLQRLAALVPRPRLHLIRFHGVLAPNATLRSQIVPSEADQATDTAQWGRRFPRATPSPGPPRRVPTSSLISHPRFRLSSCADTLPLPISPTHTPQWSDMLVRSEKNEPLRSSSQDELSHFGQRRLGIESSTRSLVLGYPIKKPF